MTSNQNKMAGSAYPFLEQISGEAKGRVYEIHRRTLSIGRGDENDIVIASDGVSRNHAVIAISNDGHYVITDQGSKNGVQVNGTTVPSSVLNHGDVVRIGSFVFRFGDDSSLELAEAISPEAGEMALAEYGEAPGAKPKRKGPNKRLLIYGSVGLMLGLFYLFGGDSKEKKTEDVAESGPTGKVADRFQGKEEFKMGVEGKPNVAGIEDPLLKQAEQDLSKLDWGNTSLREAEQFYRKGQREYFNGNLQRAIDFFEGALNIYRSHPLAQIYLARAKNQAELDAKKDMAIGIQYFESLQYQRAIYYFQQVIALMAHRPDEKIIGECEKYIGVAKKRLQAAEMFP